jgi:hypothetical protein
MNQNDYNLIEQMCAAGLGSKITDLVEISRNEKVAILINDIGTKWLLHPDNFVQRIENV